MKREPRLKVTDFWIWTYYRKKTLHNIIVPKIDLEKNTQNIFWGYIVSFAQIRSNLHVIWIYISFKLFIVLLNSSLWADSNLSHWN